MWGGLRLSGLPRSPHALVTGGGRGIGREIASALSRAGAAVTVLGRNRASLDDALAAGDARFADVADVADELAVSAAIASAAARQPIDIPRKQAIRTRFVKKVRKTTVLPNQRMLASSRKSRPKLTRSKRRMRHLQGVEAHPF